MPLLPDTSQMISCISRSTCQVSQLSGQRQSYAEEAHTFTGRRHDWLACQAECPLSGRKGSSMAILPSSRQTNTQHCPTGAVGSRWTPSLERGTLCWADRPELKERRHHLPSTNHVAFGKAGESKEHFWFLRVFFINCKEEQVSNNSTGFPRIC